MKTILLISRVLNDNKEVLEKKISEIDSFIEECVPKNTVLHMGSTLTGEFRRRMEILDYRFVLKKQYRSGLYKSNKEMIKESDRVLIINVNQSPNMTDFEEYAKKQDTIDESVYVLRLSSK